MHYIYESSVANVENDEDDRISGGSLVDEDNDEEGNQDRAED